MDLRVAISLAVCCSCVFQASMVLSFAAISLSSWSPSGHMRQKAPSTIVLSLSSVMEASEIRIKTKSVDNGETWDILATLFGSSRARDEFFAKDFGINAVHIQRNSTSMGFNKIQDLNLPCINPNDGSMNTKILFDTSNLLALRKRGSMDFIDNSNKVYGDFCRYIEDGGSAVIPVAEENVLMPFRGEVEEVFREHFGSGHNGLDTVCNVGINVYHSGPSAVALNRHCDEYDVLVLHLNGKKDWEIGVFEEGHAIDHKDPEAMEAVQSWKNLTLAPGDLLYIPKGVFHAATTAAGYESTTHATIGIEY